MPQNTIRRASLLPQLWYIFVLFKKYLEKIKKSDALNEILPDLSFIIPN
jgi:hypothetical protein